MKPALLDARVHAWRQSAESAGCTLMVRPSSKSYSSTVSASVTCANVDVGVRISSDDLRDGSAWLGEFLRLLHAATARPVRLQAYDWLQQLLWPNVCTLTKCSFCHHGDRHLTVHLSSPKSKLTPQPQVVTASLYDWSEVVASVEYLELLAAIQRDAGGANPEAPLSLVVEALPALSRVVNTTCFLTAMEVLLDNLSKTTSDWFQVVKVSVSLAQELAYQFHRKMFKVLLASKLPLALPGFSPYQYPCDSRTTMHKWMFRHSAPKESPPLAMPVITELCMRTIGCPSARVFTEFCTWLAPNDSLKVLVIEMPTHLSASYPEMWEDLGFALFSPFSKLNLDHLELDIQGLGDSDIDAMASGSQRLCLDDTQPNTGPQLRLQRKLKVKSSGVLTATVIKFFRHFGRAVHELETRVVESDYPLLLQSIFSCSPGLEVLKVRIYGDSSPQLSRRATTFTRPKLRSLTIDDDTDSGTSRFVCQTLDLVGQALSHLCVKSHHATDVIADTILHSCPSLATLALSRAEVSFWERLSKGYLTGTCKVSDLTISEALTPTPWVFELVQTLTNAASPLTRTLKKFRIGAINLTSWRELDVKLLEMLDVNPFLVQLVLPHDIDESMRAKHGEIVANRANQLCPRQRFAVLSCSPSIVNGKVPREIWRLVLNFSAQPVRRTVTTRSPWR